MAPKSEGNPMSTQINPYRQIPIRLLGYANEIGEASKPWLKAPPLSYIYPGSYAVAVSYVLVDSNKHAKISSAASGGDGYAGYFVDGLVWQMLASVMVPGFVVNRVVWGVGRAGEGEQRLERSDSKSIIPPSYATNNLPLVASLLVPSQEGANNCKRWRDWLLSLSSFILSTPASNL